MPGNLWGKALTLTSWGESHGPAIGGVIDGLPPDLPLDLDKIQEQLNRRRPGQSEIVSSRNESDELHILSGLLQNKTTGTPLAFLIHNTNQQSKDYDALQNVFRPGHADYSYYKKYGHVDYRGGGRASARETAIRVAAGAIALQVLQSLLTPSIRVKAAVVQIGPYGLSSAWDGEDFPPNPVFCPEPRIVDVWYDFLKELKDKGLSTGALVEVQAHHLPAGLGEPVYDKLDADLAKALMSINAVKGVEIGDGFASVAATHGYDELSVDNGDISFNTNRAGGILGGISTGQPLICRLALKPTSSTLQPRQTITKDLKTTSITIAGRHDPCVGIRAVPIAEAMVSFVLADHMLRWRGQCGSIA